MANPVLAFQAQRRDTHPNFVFQNIQGPESRRRLEGPSMRLGQRETGQMPERQAQWRAQIVPEGSASRYVLAARRNAERIATWNAQRVARLKAEADAELEAEWIVDYDAVLALRKN